MTEQLRFCACQCPDGSRITRPPGIGVSYTEHGRSELLATVDAVCGLGVVTLEPTGKCLRQGPVILRGLLRRQDAAEVARRLVACDVFEIVATGQSLEELEGAIMSCNHTELAQLGPVQLAQQCWVGATDSPYESGLLGVSTKEVRKYLNALAMRVPLGSSRVKPSFKGDRTLLCLFCTGDAGPAEGSSRPCVGRERYQLAVALGGQVGMQACPTLRLVNSNHDTNLISLMQSSDLSSPTP